MSTLCRSFLSFFDKNEICFLFVCIIFKADFDFLQDSFNQLENWVLCRIFLKKRSTTKAEYEIIHSSENFVGTQPRFYDFMMRDKIVLGSVSSSSSSSRPSGITDEVSSSGEDHEGGSNRNIFWACCFFIFSWLAFIHFSF